jgi:hypothetical protein
VIRQWPPGAKPLTRLPPKCPTPATHHVGGHARLVEEDQAPEGDHRLHDPPDRPRIYDVRPQLLASVNAFFEADPAARVEPAQHPDVRLDAVLGQQPLSDLDEDQVGFSLDQAQQPSLMGRQARTAVATCRSCPPSPFAQRPQPADRRRNPNPIPPRRRPTRQSLPLNRSDHPLAQVLLICSAHPC